MTDYALSNQAEADVRAIGRYTVRTWGIAQAETYILGLHDTFQNLATDRQLGRSIDHLRPGYLRFEYQSHSIFYKRAGSTVLIMRVLHGRMDPDRHL